MEGSIKPMPEEWNKMTKGQFMAAVTIAIEILYSMEFTTFYIQQP